MNRTVPKIVALVFAVLMLTALMPVGIPNNQTTTNVDNQDTDGVLNDMLLNTTDFNLTNDYQKIWEPNNIRGSTHAVAVTDDGEYMASAGGYLNDREVHIYRWLADRNQYYPIWDSGDTEIQGDVMDVDFMDADNDNRLEVVAGSQDGHIYVFEQRGEQNEPFGIFSDAHIWELVWTSGRVLDRQVWSVMAYDIDHDSHDEIIAGVWDWKVHVFDFVDSEAYPYCLDDNWFIFEHVWDSGNTIRGRVNDVAVVDSDNDTHYEIVAGSQDKKVYLFESCDCLIHNYELIWDSGDTIYAPIISVAASQDLDTDKFGEIVVSAYGLGVYIFEFNGTGYPVRKINRDIMSWEKGISETAGVYTGYEADIWGDRKVYGWEAQGIYENDPIPPPYDTELLGGASALGGPWDDSETTFNSAEQFQFMNEWDLEPGSDSGQFSIPYDIALAPDGTFYVTDFLNERVVRVNQNMEFIAMWGEHGNESGQFDSPTGIAVDDDGFVYVADLFNSRVQKFNPNGVFITSWGTNGSMPGQFYAPFDVAVKNGKLYVTDYGNNRIQVLDAETGEFLLMWGSTGSGPGQFNLPAGVAIDSLGDVYITDVNNDRVQKFNATGGYLAQWGTLGVGPGDFDGPSFITIDSDDRIYVSDTGNERVQKFSASGDYESEFGSSGTGPGQFQSSVGMALHPTGGIVVVDATLNRIQRFGVQEYEMVEAFDAYADAGTPTDLAFDSEGNYYVTSVFEPTIHKYASDGTFLLNWSLPMVAWWVSVEVDEFDRVYVTDYTNSRIHVFDTMGNLITSFGSPGTGDGQLDGPVSIAFDTDQIYISEWFNSRISVFDRSFNFRYHIGGPGAGLGLLNSPHGIEIGPDGLLYVSDRYNYRIQRFFINGTPIDTWPIPDEALYLAFDAEGNLYATGSTQQTIKKYSPTGILVDIFDDEVANYEDRLGYMTSWGIEYRAENASLYVADTEHNKIVMLRPYLALNNESVTVVDYGRWEEITGDATDLADFYIAAETSLEIENIAFAVSQDLKTFKTIDPMDYNFYFEGNLGPFGFIAIMGVNVDNVLRNAGWDNFRYLRISVRGGVTYDIDATWGRVDRPIATALTVRLGDVKTTGVSDGIKEIIIGTVDGEILAYTSMGVEVWASQSDQPRFSLGTQIWDIVQAVGKGRIPTWMFHDSLIEGSDLLGSLPSFDHFMSYTMVNIDYNSALDIVATVRDGAYTRLIYLRNTGSDAAPVYNYVPNYFVTQSTLVSDQILSYASVTMGDLDGDYDDDLILGTAWLDVDLGWTYEIRYFEQTAVDFWTEQPGYLSDMNSLIVGNGFMPRVSLYDMDYDNDLDITLILDHIYYFRQTGYTQGVKFYLQLDTTYFQTINDDLRQGEMPGKIGFSDFDMDGDIDVTVPHSTLNITFEGIDTDASRMTYWENTGNRNEVEWTKRRSMFEPDFTGTLLDPDHGYTGPEFHDMNGDNIPDLLALHKQSIDVFYGKLDHDTLIAATYPYIHMVEVDKRTQADGYWGYEAYDSWTNWVIFETWTRSLEFGDVDHDGKPEVFVGSFDNNVIAFEQVANNTYRRSWRSRDFFLISWLDGTEVPIYTNIRDMVIGDQDLDGKEEVIVTAGYNVFVFEAIDNDYYDLVWVSPSIAIPPYFDPAKPVPPVPRAPNVVAVDKDLDADGRPEILVGAEYYLILYEMVGDNNYTQVALYELAPQDLGTPMIRGIKTGNLDRDEFRDIVVVGTDDELINGIAYPSYGWLRVFENLKQADGTHANDTYFEYYNSLTQAPAYAVDIADNDLDSWPEVFVGTGIGVEIYEAPADNSLAYIQFIPTPAATKAIQIGNTDGDSWLEIVAGTGKNLTVFEQNQTYPRSNHIYDAVWTSGELAEEITDIRLGDINLNNRTEIIATAAKGYLYDFEWVPMASETEGMPFLLSSAEEGPSAELESVVSPLMTAPDWGGMNQPLEKLARVLRRVDA